MADSATTRNRLRKQEVGAKTNAWGGDWNEDGGSDRLDESLDGFVAFALSGLKTLTSTNYETDEARMRIINVTGGTGGTITIPAVEKWYLVRNGATGDVIISNGTNSVTIVSSEITAVVTNGTTIYSANAKKYVDAAILTASLSASLPSQTGNAGKSITTDGTTASWAFLIPSQTGNSGKFMTTNGTDAAWAALTDSALTAPLIGATPAAGAAGYASFRLPHGVAPTTNLTNGDVWSTTAGFFGRVNGATITFAKLGANIFTDLQTLAASTAGVSGYASLNIPHGAAPTTNIANGDLWTTTAGIYVRINGATVGPLAASPITEANSSISVGVTAAGTAGNDNTSAGASALAAVTAGGNDNVGVGYQAGKALTTGDNSVFVGANAGKTITTGGDNTIIGKDAGAVLGVTAANCVIIGSGAADAMTSNASGVIAIGKDAMGGQTSTTCTNNIAIGNGALGATVSAGTATVVIGASSAQNATGNSNTVIGDNSAVSAFTGSGNVIVGNSAGNGLLGGNSNIFVGSTAGGITTGSSNTIISSAGSTGVTTGSNNVIIGGVTGLSSSLATNVIIADGAGTKKFWHDNTDAFVLHATTANAANAVLDSTSKALQRSTSSIRYKRDVEPMDDKFADAVLKLEPVWYRSKCAGDDQSHSYWGFIAEDAALVDPRLVQWGYDDDAYEEMPVYRLDEKGKPTTELLRRDKVLKDGAQKVPDGFAYDRLTVQLLSIVKRQQADIAALKALAGL